jgi:16S rRNA (cytosine1402-N4)-methyltransferase
MSLHVPVLAREVIEGLRIHRGGAYVDATVGGGGHSAMIAECLGLEERTEQDCARGRLIALDRDLTALEGARRILAAFSNVTFIHSNYSNLANALAEAQIENVDGVLIDAGFSSLQLDNPARGFSFQTEGPLDMRLDQSQGETAAEYLSRVNEEELAQVLRTYGDVGPARRIARSIIDRSRSNSLKTTSDLAEAIRKALDFVRGEPEETRTVFQAVRMAVNDELKSLETGVRAALDILAPSGRVAVISFHSGEDRVVKNIFREASRPLVKLHPDGRIASREAPRARVLTSSPILPEESEMRNNSRARSAKLRIAEKL